LQSRIELGMRQQIEAELTALLEADVTALKLWLHSQEANATAAAQSPAIRQPILQLLEQVHSGKSSALDLLQAPQRQELLRALTPFQEQWGYAGYVIMDPQSLIVASNVESIVGQVQAMPMASNFLARVLDGRALVSPPFPSMAILPDEWGGRSAGVPTMFAAAVVRDDHDQAVGILALRVRPEQDFTRILNVGQFGRSGETYAFDKRGVLISRSRFEDQLKQLGLQADKTESRSVLSVEIRDPGVDLTTGARSALRRSEQPLTRLAADAIAGNSAVDTVGYRDYRGVPSVGAWTWLPDYGFGVGTEVDIDDAFGPLMILRTAFWTLFGLLAAAAVAMLGMTLLAGRLERRMREAVISAGQLGQYMLEEKIGEGGMGAVYRGRHALLRRPTAVKLLEPAKTTEVSVARFEREVQMTSQLNHPNTITIYDYGRTQEGVFYYAMEYLDGFSLQSLVDRFGPQPDGRVIPILLQVCGSLMEAHSMGLIHRDIKPANIMLTERGGVYDFAKLLDFGLVKAVDSTKMTALTAADSITGTPLYMSPESIQDADRADARSDLYSLGAVGYFLLTGAPVFLGTNIVEIIRQHLETSPLAPSQRFGQKMSVELEHLILDCLAKEPERRPQSARQLAEALARCAAVHPWTASDAENWWRQFQPTRAPQASGMNTTGIALASTMAYSKIDPKK
jgi:eukaryotic-like serine/threonine-protein kinase